MAQAISTVQLQDVNLMVQQAWANSQAMIDNSALDSITVDTLQARQAGAQGPLVQVVTDPTKDYDAVVWWPDFCGESAVDCTIDVCEDLTADQAEMEKKEYKINSCIEDKFSVSDEDFFGSWLSKAEFIAANINQKITNIINRLNIKALQFLHANSGSNNGGQYVQNVLGQYEIPSESFGSTNVITKMLYDAQMSRINAPFLIDGKNLWETVMNVRLNTANSDGKGDAGRSVLFGNIVHDPLGFSKVPEVANSTFMVSPSAYAVLFKNYIPNTVPVYDEALGKWKYSIPLGRYGAVLDVFTQRVCENGAKNLYSQVWVFKLHYDFLANPLGCVTEAGQVTGIIEYSTNDYGTEPI